jgi:hypothetical protein
MSKRTGKPPPPAHPERSEAERGAEPEQDDDYSPDTSARIPVRSVTLPPSYWDRENSVLTSATRTTPPEAPPPDQPIAGTDPQLSEADARRILDARFTAAGVALQADYRFHDSDLLVVLDGYDPARRIGYTFVSHRDADVVTDFDSAAELAFQHLASEARAFVLVVHDVDVPSADALENRIDAFFEQVRRLAP